QNLSHRQLPHNQQMAQILVEEIQSAADLELLIDHLPDELESADDSELGNPQLMSPEAVQAWIRHRKQASI
ncbi:MAG: hypothetical protein OER04_12345, partial [Cyclobacteriaceae bacterium]|nr:hypothetical protein [Cyclobacteriaceae bacterium]